MGRKEGKRKRLKRRVLKNIFLILVICLIGSTAAGYWYFANVVKKQKIEMEANRLSRLSAQMTFMMEEVAQFARNILVDEELHHILEEEGQDTEFFRQRRYDKVTKRLVFYENLRPYIKSLILQMQDGMNYGSRDQTRDTAYIMEHLQREEIAGKKGAAETYSDPYYDETRQGDTELVCYQVPLFDQYHFGEQKGTLYIEIAMDYFLDRITEYMQEKDLVCLTGEEGNILYAQDAGGRLTACVQNRKLETDTVSQVKDGYLLCSEIGDSGWKLSLLVTNAYLWEGRRFVMGFFVLSFLFSMGLILLFLSKRIDAMIHPITALSEQMERIAYGAREEIAVIRTGDEIETLYACFAHMMEQIQKGEEEQRRYERQKREMEYDITLSQINPHYLYNVLNTVVYLASAEKNQDVVKIVRALIYTLHDTLNIGEGDVETTLEKERSFTKRYLEIQKYRYPDRFQVIFDCEKELENCMIPKVTIQPLVENAIRHGILPTETMGTVLVKASAGDGMLTVTIEDDGVGIREIYLERFARGETLKAKENDRKHIGIENVRDRIRYLYGKDYGMEIQKRDGGGTKVLLRIPRRVRKEQMEEEARSEKKV